MRFILTLRFPLQTFTSKQEQNYCTVFYDFLKKICWIQLQQPHLSSAYCLSQNWVTLQQFYAFVYWIFIAEPRFFKKSCHPPICMDETFRLGKVKVVAWFHAVCFHEWRLDVTVPYCRSVLLEPGGELPRGLHCVITGTVIALGSVDDRSVWAEFSKLLKTNCSVILPFSEYGLKCKTEASKWSS